MNTLAIRASIACPAVAQQRSRSTFKIPSVSLSTQTKIAKAAVSFVAPPSLDLFMTCVCHVADNVEIARETPVKLLDPVILSQTIFMFALEYVVDQALGGNLDIDAFAMAGVIQGVLLIVKFFMLMY